MPRNSRRTASTQLAAARGEPWLARYGGRISSEWEFAKALQVLEEDPVIYAAADRWIEAADWIVWQLCGVETRNACTAGYKAHVPGRARTRPTTTSRALNPDFGDFVRDKLDYPLSPLGGRAGGLTRRRGPLDSAAEPGSRSRSATSTPTSPRRRRSRSGRARCWRSWARRPATS